jgi:hypothetical protein
MHGITLERPRRRCDRDTAGSSRGSCAGCVRWRARNQVSRQFSETFITNGYGHSTRAVLDKRWQASDVALVVRDTVAQFVASSS